MEKGRTLAFLVKSLSFYWQKNLSLETSMDRPGSCGHS